MGILNNKIVILLCIPAVSDIPQPLRLPKVMRNNDTGYHLC